MYWSNHSNIDRVIKRLSFNVYPLQLEDDVITKPGYHSVMKNFALNQKVEDWFLLEFSSLGFIGNHSRTDMPRLIHLPFCVLCGCSHVSVCACMYMLIWCMCLVYIKPFWGYCVILTILKPTKYLVPCYPVLFCLWINHVT